MMPGAVEMSRHYSSYSDFQHDQAEKSASGWTLESFHLSERATGWRWLAALHRQGVDAHYLRGDFPTA